MSEVTRAFATTSVGRVRQRNEDAFLLMPEQDLYVVADGMGGHLRGDVAANLCVDAIRDWFTGKVGDDMMNRVAGAVRALFGLHSPGETDLVAAVDFANRVIYEMSVASTAFRGMGTTLVGTYFHGATLFVVYSGDSRLYRFRNGRLRQLSRDHSLLNEYLRLEMIRPEDAKNFPHRNVIMKALGLKERAELEFFRRRVRKGDVYLLSSDGLTDMVEDEEIEEILADGGSLEEMCQKLVDAAMESGGHDNITVMLVEYRGS
ncbi:MAG: Stp1/IreP family PP2C-type Ser/Thr phosphatase [Deltaproteobacteria bacterium]|nr:Stp1/IreP family PP2C-type Ser/Thr phosphatase [Deltaproteobacteria bacterium]